MKPLSCIATLLVVTALLAPLSHAQVDTEAARRTAATVPEVQAKWFALDNDSIRVEYALPTAEGRPAVIVLSDRFGPHSSLRAVLKVLAQLGFRAYAPPLNSAPEQSFSATPAAQIDSTDIVRVTRVAVDIMNEDNSGARVFLLGFDVGANIAIELAARFPFFKGAALFYPTGGPVALDRLVDMQCPMQLHVPQYDEDFSLDDVEELRDIFAPTGKRLHVFFYKDAKRFFFNPSHANYHKVNTQKAWNQINKQFRMP